MHIPIKFYVKLSSYCVILCIVYLVFKCYDVFNVKYSAKYKVLIDILRHDFFHTCKHLCIKSMMHEFKITISQRNLRQPTYSHYHIWIEIVNVTVYEWWLRFCIWSQKQQWQGKNMFGNNKLLEDYLFHVLNANKL